MRSIQLILIAVLSLLFSHVATSALPARNQLLRRDDPSPSATDSSPAASSGGDGKFPSLSTTTKPAPSSTNAPATQTAESQDSPSPVSSGSNSTVSTTSSPTPTASVDPASDGAPLPLEPQLTAPLAVGGVVLLVSGIIYTFVGIKSRNIQTFISTAYLISLGITVLIVYVMTPPVSVGTQGAYLAAIVLPGLLLAAGAVLFKDVTEGLGCAVGGFALGMWFMTLKPGGLLDSQAGKIVLLCCFTGVAFSLSFSRYTRTYGIIGATAFAGATALILGIDCFSKTGLKEFWLYIWGLNGNLFPLGTHTYPLTKNLKAEIAGIPIITLFGILSQIQVWKIVQKKRAKRAEVEEVKKREKEDEEARLGKDLEARTRAEKMVWERTYADASRDVHSDSGIGSEPTNSEKAISEKGSARTSVSDRAKVEEHVEVSEIDDQGRQRYTKAARRLTPHIIVSVAEEEEGEEALTSPRSVSASSPKLPPLDFGYGQQDTDVDAKAVSVAETEIEPAMLESLKTKSLKPKTVPSPVIVPLPFTVPNGPSTPNDDNDDASSVATAATTIKRASKRFSTNSLFEKMTKGRMSWHARQGSDATSVQAVADSPTCDSFHAASLPGSRRASVDREPETAAPLSSPKLSPSLSPKAATDDKRHSRGTDYFSQPRSPTTGSLLSPTSGIKSPIAVVVPHSEHGIIENATTVDGDRSTDLVGRKQAPAALNLESIKANTSSSSKVMNAFRTNEWAKHLESANEPEEDSIPVSEPPSPLEPPRRESEASDELPEQPESEAALASTISAEASAPPSIPSSTSTPPPADELAPKVSWPKPSSRRRTSGSVAQIPAEIKQAAVQRRSSRDGRTPSRMSVMRSSSGSRTRGGPLGRQATQQALVTSPIHEDVEAIFPPQEAKRRSSFGVQPDSLLAQREAMVSQSSIVRSASQASSHPYNANYSSSRVSMSQNNARSSSSLSRRSSNPEQFSFPQRQPSAASIRAANQPYSPPPPVRTYSPINVAQPLPIALASPTQDRPLHQQINAPDEARRSAMLAQWRASLAGEQQQRKGSQMDIDIEAGKGWLDMQRQQRQYEQYRNHAVGWGTERTMSPTSVVQNPMHHQMAAHEAHKEVLRRMQSKSKVNK